MPQELLVMVISPAPSVSADAVALAPSLPRHHRRLLLCLAPAARLGRTGPGSPALVLDAMASTGQG